VGTTARRQLQQDQETWIAEQQRQRAELTEWSQTLDAHLAELETSRQELLAERESWNAEREQQHAELSTRSQEFGRVGIRRQASTRGV